MTVKRYDAMHKDVWTDESGKYVRYDDYAALKIERDSLKNKMELINGLMEVVEQANALSKEHVEKLVKELDEARGQVVSLAVENAEMKSKARELIDEACLVYRKYNDTQMPDRDLVDGQTLQEMHNACQETPDTESAIANIQAQGVEKFADHLLCPDLDETIRAFADQLRKGASND